MASSTTSTPSSRQGSFPGSGSLYAALDRVTRAGALDARVSADLAVTIGVTLLALALGATTLRRRTA